MLVARKRVNKPNWVNPRKGRFTARVEVKCRVCGKIFFFLKSRFKYGYGKYCSRTCQYADNCGEKHPMYKDGRSKDREFKRRWELTHRHKNGISRRYSYKYGGPAPIPLKVYRQRYKALMKAGGELPTKRIQMVYEDNIKKYGTLTCIYCLKPIEFGKDTLEHKIPLSRGGSNQYENLAIACNSCNSKKGKKLLEEWKGIQKSENVI